MFLFLIIAWGLLKLTKNLKILFITYTHSNGGGGEAVLTTLVNNLPKTWQIDILEVTQFNVKKEPLNKNIKLLPPLTKYKDHTKLNKFFNVAFSIKPQLIKNIRDLEGYDVVIGYLYLHSTFLLPFFDGVKKVIWFQGMMDDLISWGSPLNMGYYEKRMYFKLQENALQCVDTVIVPSNICLRCLDKVFPESSKKAKVLYNGIDIENVNERSKEKIDAPKLYELFQNKEPNLIVIGRINSNKNFSLALETIKVLKERNILCNLLVLGSGNENDGIDLPKLAISLGIEKQVHFLGYQQNPLPFLRHSKLLLITSFSEGFPTVATEAMALGIPFVTTPVAGASEELANNETCGLVSDWNAKEYADKIEKLLTDEALYQEMSKNCKEHIKNYSVENYVASFKKILEDIPEKSRQKKDKNKNFFLNILLFIFYSSFYLSIDNHNNKNIIKMRWLNLIHKPNFLNICKLVFRFLVHFACVLSFPCCLLMSTFLIFRNLKSREN